MFNDFMMDLAKWLGDIVGRSGVAVLKFSLGMMVTYLVWGVWWHLIIHKTGFRGDLFWFPFLAIYLPLALALSGEFALNFSPGVVDFLQIFWGIGFIGSLMAIALVPWPTCKPTPTPKSPQINKAK